MSLTRRLFTRSLPAAPILAKQALSAHGAELAGIRLGVAGSAAGESGAPAVNTGWGLGKFIKAGLTNREEVLEVLERTSWTGNLDPDLFANRSFSLAAKFRLQRRRNAVRQLHAEENDAPTIWRFVDTLRGRK